MTSAPLEIITSRQSECLQYPTTPVRDSRDSRDAGSIVRTGAVAALNFDEEDKPSASASVQTVREYPSPERYYKVQRGDDGRFSVLFTPSAKNYGRGVGVIYKIKKVSSDEESQSDGETKTGPSKIGKTEQGFIKRMRQHISCANAADKDRGQGLLYQAMREEGSQFVMGVVTTVESKDEDDDKEGLGDLEDDVIADHQSLEHGFNQVGGGGGGTIAVDDEKVKLPKLGSDSFRTPTKPGYPIRRRWRKTKGKNKTRLFIDVTPNGKKRTFVVYGFRRDDGKWLIGETEQTFMQRMYGYHYDFNHPERDTGQRPLPIDVREDPTRWKVHILYQGPAVKRMEALWIEAKNSIEEGFNQVGGGGGPSSSKRTVSLSTLTDIDK